MKKVLIVCIAFVGFVFQSIGQTIKDSSEIHPKDITSLYTTNKDVFSFGLGAAYSTIDLAIYGIGGSGAYPTSTSPVYNAFLDYGISRKTCIGVEFTYQSVTGIAGDGDGSAVLGATEYITRYNVGLRFIHYTSKNLHYSDKNATGSFYYGGRIGLSYWTDVMSNPQYDWLETLHNSTQTNASIQVFCGYRFLLSANITLNFEFGIGTPYLLELGLSYRFKAKKDK